MKKPGLAAVAAFVFSLAQFVPGSAAHAQFYVSGNVGGVLITDVDIDETSTIGGLVANASLDIDPGWGVNGALGHAWGLFRVEGEVSYRVADLDSLTVNSLSVPGFVLTGLGPIPVSGEVSSLAFMANAWRDFKTGTKFKPYIGGGIGLARIGFEAGSADDSAYTFAYQLGGGLGYEITQNVTLALSYKFFGTTTADFESMSATFGTVTDEVGPIYTHNVELGLRIKF